VLVYYDKTYRTGLSHKAPGLIQPLAFDTTNHHQNAVEILKAIEVADHTPDRRIQIQTT
jgi:hypothetical protein